MRDKKYMVFAALGFELVGIVLAAIYIGQILDEKFLTKGLMVAIISMAGLAGWTYRIYKFNQSFEKRNEDKNDGVN